MRRLANMCRGKGRPYAGSVIEIDLNPDLSVVGVVPTRERGLKWNILSADGQIKEVAPTRGAWIEIPLAPIGFNSPSPYAGAWIEIRNAPLLLANMVPLRGERD